VEERCGRRAGECFDRHHDPPWPGEKAGSMIACRNCPSAEWHEHKSTQTVGVRCIRVSAKCET
jgi:hypothetical protein